ALRRVCAWSGQRRIDLANLAPDRQPIAPGRAGHLDRLDVIADRRDKLHGSASRRTSRGWGPAVRGEPMIKFVSTWSPIVATNFMVVRAAGRRGAGAPPSEAGL